MGEIILKEVLEISDEDDKKQHLNIKGARLK
jgi:hypothetical protein